MSQPVVRSEGPRKKCGRIVKEPKEATHLPGIGDGTIGVTNEHGAIGAFGAGLDPIARLHGDGMKARDPALVDPAAGNHFLKEGGKGKNEGKVDDDVKYSEAKAFENVIGILHLGARVRYGVEAGKSASLPYKTGALDGHPEVLHRQGHGRRRQAFIESEADEF
jgi:hypothetical protein